MSRLRFVYFLPLILSLSACQKASNSSQPQAEATPTQAGPPSQKLLTEAEARPMLMQVATKIQQISTTRDAEAFAKMAADNLVDIDPDGKVSNKQQEMDTMKSSDLKLDSIKFSDVDPHLFGDTAIVVGTSTVKGQYQGRSLSGTYRFQEVLQRRSGASGSNADDWVMLSCSGVRLNSATVVERKGM